MIWTNLLVTATKTATGMPHPITAALHSIALFERCTCSLENRARLSENLLSQLIAKPVLQGIQCPET
jgi:hypothetical protein